MQTATHSANQTDHRFDPQRSEEEIRYMESRLDEIGHDGDCAYEKAMIRFFQKEVAERKAQLAAYRSN